MQLRFVAIGFLAGVLLRSWLHMSRVNAHALEGSVFTLLVVAIVLVLFFFCRRYRTRGVLHGYVLLFGCALVFGMLRFEYSIPRPAAVPSEPAMMSGIVAGTPIRSPQGMTMTVRIGSDRNILAHASSSIAPVASGSTVEFYCRVKPVIARGTDPFTGPYRQVFANEQRNIIGQCTALSLEVLAGPSLLQRLASLPERFRQDVMTRARTMIPEPQVSVLGSVVLGASAGLPSDVVEAFRKTGTLHILVVSGSHFSLLSGWLLTALQVLPISSTARSVGVASGLFLFLALIGFPVPAVRGWLAALSLLASRALNRPRSAIHLLLLVAAGMALVDPWLPLFSLGFQLSVFATLGIISLTRPIRDFFAVGNGAAWPKLSDAFATTLAATVATLPLLLGAFGTLSLVTVVANLVIVSVAPALLVFGLLFFALTAILPPVAGLLAPVLSMTVAAFVGIVKSFADVAWANVAVGNVPGAVIAAESAAFIAVCWRAAAPGTPGLPFLAKSGRLS